MISRAIDILKKNTVIIWFYLLSVAVTLVFMYFYMHMDYSNYTHPDQLFAALGQLMIAYLILGVFYLFFVSGYSKMLAEAVSEGTTSAGSFVQGIKSFTLRVFLLSLLTFIFAICYIIALGIIMIPIILLSSAFGIGGLGTASDILSVFTSLFTCAISALVIPFIILWVPAVFIDNTGVIEGLRKGAKTAMKKYWFLVGLTLILSIPSLIDSVVVNILKDSLFSSPLYWIMTIIILIIGPIISVIMFMVYNDNKETAVLQKEVPAEMVKEKPEEDTQNTKSPKEEG